MLAYSVLNFYSSTFTFGTFSMGKKNMIKDTISEMIFDMAFFLSFPVLCAVDDCCNSIIE